MNNSDNICEINCKPTSNFSVVDKKQEKADRNGRQLFVSKTGIVCSEVSHATDWIVLKFAVDLNVFTLLSKFEPNLKKNISMNKNH